MGIPEMDLQHVGSKAGIHDRELPKSIGKTDRPWAELVPDADPAGARTMIAILALACFMSGFGAAWLLRLTFGMARASWSQERMQRKVRYWQDRAAQERALTERLIGQLAAGSGHHAEPAARPPADAG
jgi:hypothetical protein